MKVSLAMSKGRQDDEGMTITKQDQITNYYKYSYLYEYQIRLNTAKSPQYLHFFYRVISIGVKSGKSASFRIVFPVSKASSARTWWKS